MLRQWEVSCMQCCVLGLTSALSLTWLADISQTLARTLDSGKAYIQVFLENERLYAGLPG